MAERLEPRLGMGFDVNEYGPGDHLPLCGVSVPHEFGVARRDNRDVPLNALTDALFGAVGQADDHAHFEPDSPRWHGGKSEEFLGRAVELAVARRARIVNANVTIICERPALAPFRARMRERLAEMLSVTADRVSVIATPAAAIGFAGRREGLAAQALVTLEVPKL
jgi:2-C-methyl-D-erythritol 4-phosphate cytidylyltransferase/2-C-methyl-D-erythritol 2,4-cyclodiphosphate synthase